jgi:FdhD protein
MVFPHLSPSSTFCWTFARLAKVAGEKAQCNSIDLKFPVKETPRRLILAQRDHMTKILRYQAGKIAEQSDAVASEEPLEIRVRGKAISVTLRTPGHDEELAGGFLLSEGVIRQAADIESIECCDRNEQGNVLNVRLAPLVPVDFDKLTRHVFASSSCGLCGKATIDSIRGQFAAVQEQFTVSAATLLGLPAKMRQSQELFAQTGGVHAAAIFSDSGELTVLREDVGRHNAVDKALGYALMHGLLPLRRSILMLSGRCSFEIMQKAAAARIAVIAAVSAPSSLAVEFAQEMGQTLVGFVRGDRLNIYAHPQRIIL